MIATSSTTAIRFGFWVDKLKGEEAAVMDGLAFIGDTAVDFNQECNGTMTIRDAPLAWMPCCKTSRSNISKHS